MWRQTRKLRLLTCQ
eukprot:UN11876